MVEGVVRKVRYTYRLRPGATATAALLEEWDRTRWVWNQLVETSLQYRVDGTEFGYKTQDKLLTGWRAEHVWLKDGSSVAQQQKVRDFAAARNKALMDRKNKVTYTKRFGMPRFKSVKRDLPSLNYTRRGFNVRPDSTGVDRLLLPGKVSIPVVWSRPLPSVPFSARVSQNALGEWYASFVVETADEPLEPVGRTIGVDWGVTETATTTDDAYDLPHAEHGKQVAAQLADTQRKMVRRRPAKGQPGSKGYRKARRQAARLQTKAARRRQDDRRKWAKQMVRDHDQLAVEDFKPKFREVNFSANTKVVGRTGITVPIRGVVSDVRQR